MGLDHEIRVQPDHPFQVQPGPLVELIDCLPQQGLNLVTLGLIKGTNQQTGPGSAADNRAVVGDQDHRILRQTKHGGIL